MIETHKTVLLRVHPVVTYTDLDCDGYVECCGGFHFALRPPYGGTPRASYTLMRKLSREGKVAEGYFADVEFGAGVVDVEADEVA